MTKKCISNISFYFKKRFLFKKYSHELSERLQWILQCKKYSWCICRGWWKTWNSDLTLTFPNDWTKVISHRPEEKTHTHTHTEKTLRHYKDVTHPRLHTHTHTSAHALSLMSWYRVGNSHWWLCQLNSSMDQTDKVCRAATVWTDSSLSSRPYPLSCVNTHSHQLIPRNKAIKHCD